VQETALPPDAVLVDQLRAGDDAAFAVLLDKWSSGMHRVARGFVATADSAAEVVQDAWLAVIQGLPGFEGRPSLEILEISAANQRVLLHRARAYVRGRLEAYFAEV
jgi:Sigma-70 region 2